MDTFLQQIVNGLTLGSLYAIVALGYTMVYGIIQLINFAHGEVVMFGAMITLTVISVATGSGLPPLAAILAGTLVAVPACMALGYLLERIAYRPLRTAPRLAPLITAIGMSIVLQQFAMMIWSRNILSFPQVLPVTLYEVAGASISNLQIIIIGLCLAMMAGLAWTVYRTRLGAAMRATAENAEIARLMGVDVDRVIAITFIIGAALAAVAGLMVGIYYGLAHYTMGATLGLKAFSAAVLGGIGNIPGAMVGGILLGLVEALGAGYIGDLTDLCQYEVLDSLFQARCADGGNLVLFGSNYQDVFAFVVLILVLVFRPSGLLGERVADRA
ncbi:MAG: branched-chain amino acid ABC transporter permease [Proteobacteria bacterium]|nr:branched-chain amino acid ABC transporter permease [Pseudomonadota bacterium]